MTSKTTHPIKDRHYLNLTVGMLDPFRGFIAIASAVALLVPAHSVAYAQQDQPLAGAAASDTAPIPADQLDSLVAPAALYPDPLLAQTLAVSTYPLEVIQLQQWMANNSYLKGQALADAWKSSHGIRAFKRWRRFPTWSNSSATTSRG